MFESFNNRDWSLFIWGILFLSWLMWAGRKGIWNLIQAAFNKHLVIIVALVLCYICGSVYLLYDLNLWNTSMMKDAIIWTMGVAIPMIGNAIKASEGKYRLKDALLDNLKMAVIIEFIVNLYVFDLWIELLFIPFMTLVAMMMAYSEKKLIETPFLANL